MHAWSGEPVLVVAELAQRAGGEDDAEARLAQVDVSGRVAPKMLVHHLPQLRDLCVERGDDADLPGHDGRVGALQRRRLTQCRPTQTASRVSALASTW